MRPGLTLRGDYDTARLRGVARRTKSAAQGRRLLALAEIYDGGSRTKAACEEGFYSDRDGISRHYIFNMAVLQLTSRDLSW